MKFLHLLPTPPKSPTSKQSNRKSNSTPNLHNGIRCAFGVWMCVWATENRVHLNFNVIDRHRTPVLAPFLPLLLHCSFVLFFLFFIFLYSTLYTRLSPHSLKWGHTTKCTYTINKYSLIAALECAPQPTKLVHRITPQNTIYLSTLLLSNTRRRAYLSKVTGGQFWR